MAVLYVFTPKQSTELAERITALTGHTADLAEALDQWEHEHELVGELYADFDRYQIENGRLIKLVRLAWRAVVRVRTDGGLFLSAKAREQMDQFEAELVKLEQAIPQLVER